MSGGRASQDAEALWSAIRSRHPRLRTALRADIEVTALHRGERHQFGSRADLAIQGLRLMWVTDAFLAQVLYRIKARLQALGVPVLPRVAHRLAIMVAQVSIGDPVVVHPGIYLVHGQVVLDGLVEVHPGAVISPWVTIGLRAGNVVGPTLGPGVSVGTGAKVIGPVQVGAGARIGANAVVVDHVPAGVTFAGVPARRVGDGGEDTPRAVE